MREINCGRSSPADTRVSGEGRGSRAPSARAEILHGEHCGDTGCPLAAHGGPQNKHPTAAHARAHNTADEHPSVEAAECTQQQAPGRRPDHMREDLTEEVSDGTCVLWGAHTAVCLWRLVPGGEELCRTAACGIDSHWGREKKA